METTVPKKTKDFLIEFTNKGEIPVNAFKLLGASSKRGDSNKIGFYGSGLKYALAVMLREDIPFEVYSGAKRVDIGSRQTDFMDRKIRVMTINGEKTSITLEAGIDWEPWFAIREIYSNALDEGGTMKTVTAKKPEKDTTKIYVDPTAPQLQEVFGNWGMYFSTGRNIVDQNEYGKALAKIAGQTEFTVFRKGIRTYKNKSKSLFDYDLTQLDINESRVAKYSWQAKERSAQILAHGNIETVRRFIALSKDYANRNSYAEWENEFWDFVSARFTGAWLEAIGDRQLVPADQEGQFEVTQRHLVLPNRLIKKLKDFFGDALSVYGQDVGKYTVVKVEDMSSVEKELEKLNHAGFDFDIEDVFMVKFADKQHLGLAENGKVYISSDLLKPAGLIGLGPCLLEEIIHCKTGMSDNTRELQSYLIDAMYSLIEQATPKGATDVKEGL